MAATQAMAAAPAKAVVTPEAVVPAKAAALAMATVPAMAAARTNGPRSRRRQATS